MKPGATIRNIFLGIFYTWMVFGIIGAAIGGGEETSADPQESVESDPVEEESDPVEEESEPVEEESDPVEEESDPVEEESENSDDWSESTAENAFIYGVESTTEADVTKATHEDGQFVVIIDAPGATQEELIQIIGGSVGAYSIVVEEGYGGDKMEVEVQAHGVKAGSYEAEASDARSYNSGDMGEEEWAMKVLQTVETVE